MCTVLNDLETQGIFFEPVSKMEDNTAKSYNGSLRRWWLLKKALADHSLADALMLAKKAEAFITAAEEANSADGTGQGSQTSPAAEGESAPSAIPASEVDASLSEERSKFDSSESNLIQFAEAVCLDGDIRSSGLPRHRIPAPPNQAEADESGSEEVLMLSNTSSSTFVV